jgi:hypothetical protein
MNPNSTPTAPHHEGVSDRRRGHDLAVCKIVGRPDRQEERDAVVEQIPAATLPPAAKRYLAPRETADYLGLSLTATYEQLRDRGALHCVSSRLGRRIIVNREALDELLKGGDHDA